MSTQPFNSDGGFSTTANVTGTNLVASSNFVGTRLVTNLTNFNWSDPITGITLGTQTYVTLANNVFGDPWSGQVNISGVSGTSEANGIWYYSATSGNQFELRTNGGADPVDSSTWGAYTSGGIAFTLDYANIEINGQNVTIRSDHGDYDNKIWSFNSDGSTGFPALSVNLHNGGVQSGQTLQFGDPSRQAFITGPTPAAGDTAQRLIIQGQVATGSGEGGDVYIWGGDSQVNGGDIKIYAGDADSGSSGIGGNIHISGGKGTNAGGEITLIGGWTTGGTGAYVGVTGGQGSTTGGNVDLTGGYGGANGGPVNITGGISGNGLASYGNVNINAGASTWVFDNAGHLTTPGSSGDITGANVISAATFSATGNITAGNVLLVGNIDAASGASPAPSINGFDSINSLAVNTTSLANVLNLVTRNGDANPVNSKPQITLGYNGTTNYPQFIHTKHNASTAAYNTIEFWTSDGTQAGTFPANAVLGGSITQGAMQLAVYANTTVRDSVITTPAPGMMIYVTGTGMQVRGATSWNTIAGSGS